MRCIATEANQKRVNGKIRFFNAGETFDFDECPQHFVPIDAPPTIDDENIDYATMGEKWLRQYDGDPDKLAMFIMETYKDVMIPPNATWQELVNILEVQRQTNVLMVDNTGKKENRLSTMEQTADTITIDVDVVDKPTAPAKTPDELKKETLAKKKAAAAEKKAPVEEVKQTAEELSEEVSNDLDDLFRNN